MTLIIACTGLVLVVLKALDVRDGIKKKRKKHKERCVPSSHGIWHDQLTDESNLQVSDINGSNTIQNGEHDEDARLTPAERRYLERLQKIEMERLAKAARKSHRDRIHEFNQYLANLSEHYDIPKVGPG